ARLFDGFGPEEAMDLTDGLRLQFASGLTLHLRASGNAPELRIYAEAAGQAEADQALRRLMGRVRALRD
ncbi:MAG: phosphomannomutase, partial [Rhodobacteraceae bacterium]|nr:phosphomannomutase [Paracoccaceae bacterium]